MKRRILLADDSVTIQKVIELTFMDEDFEVRAVSNGDEALALLPEVKPDFIIADVHMPGANGYEVCRKTKQLRPGTPVLLLVGTFEPFDEAQARSAGADSFLKKPFDSQELLQRVEELIAAKAPAAEAPLPPALPMPLPVADWAAAPAPPPAPAPAADAGGVSAEPTPEWLAKVTAESDRRLEQIEQIEHRERGKGTDLFPVTVELVRRAEGSDHDAHLEQSRPGKGHC